MAGITTVRDVGGWNYVEMDVRDADRCAGRSPGPGCSSPASCCRSRPRPSTTTRACTRSPTAPTPFAPAARRQLAHGADLIKVMATGAMLSSETEDSRAIQFTLDELRAAVEIAHDNHKHVAAHCHALPGHRERRRGRRRQHRALHVRRRRRAGPDGGARARRWCRRSAPASCCSVTPTSSPTMPEHLRQRMAAFNDVHAAAVRRAHELGVTIAMGTDAGTPGNHHGLNAHECVFLVEQCGLSPAASIRTATRRRRPAAAPGPRRARCAGRGRLRRRDRPRRQPARRHHASSPGWSTVVAAGAVVRNDSVSVSVDQRQSRPVNAMHPVLLAGERVGRRRSRRPLATVDGQAGRIVVLIPLM